MPVTPTLEMSHTDISPELLEKAVNLAAQAHATQRDKYGMPYLMHVMRVAAQVNTVLEKTCAMLHDVVEDTEVTLDDLRREGFPERVLEVVALLTKAKDENYESYVEKVHAHPVARRIKLADLTDNMDLRRIPEVTVEDVARLNKYLRAYRLLS